MNWLRRRQEMRHLKGKLKAMISGKTIQINTKMMPIYQPTTSNGATTMLETPITHKDTSAQALAGIGMANLSGELKKIHDIVLAAARHGIDDMSGREIQAQYERIHGKRIDSGTVSARVAGLVAAGRLERCRIARPCRVAGRDIHPVRCVAQQARLAA